MALIYTSWLLGTEQVPPGLESVMSICWFGRLPAEELVQSLPCGIGFNFESIYMDNLNLNKSEHHPNIGPFFYPLV